MRKGTHGLPVYGKCPLPIDSLKIIRYEDYNQEVIRLEEQLNSYSGEILDSLNAYRTIEAEEEKIIEELDRLEGIMNKHGEKLNAYLDQFADESDADRTGCRN